MEGMLLNGLLLIAADTALLLMVLAIFLLLVRDQHLHGLLQAQCQLSEKQGRQREGLEQETREFQAALRVERAHVQQLHRKVQCWNCC